MTTLLVTGSRTWGELVPGGTREEAEAQRRILSKRMRLFHVEHGGRVRLVHGGAVGADLLCAEAGRKLGWMLEVHRPDAYKRQGMSYAQACFARNAGMVDRLRTFALTGPVECIAFWDGTSKGTGHTILLAGRAGFDPEVITSR